jgi:hypothetical protein
MSIYTVTATRNIQNYVANANNDINTDNDFLSTYLGKLAGFKNLGLYNTFVGCEAGLNNFTGSCNTFLGHDAGASNTLGTGNLALGVATGLGNLTGDDNVFLGLKTGMRNSSDKRNLYIGSYAGQYLNGNNNILMGYNNTNTVTNVSSCNNVAIGTDAIATGYYNTLLGTASVVTGTRTVVLGYSNNDSSRYSAVLGSSIRNTGNNSLVVMTVTGSNGYSNSRSNYTNINNVLVAEGVTVDGTSRHTDVLVDSACNLTLHAGCNLTLSNSTTSMILDTEFFELKRNQQSVNLAEDALTVSSKNQLLMRSASNAQLTASNNVLLATPSNVVRMGLDGLQVASAPSLTVASSNNVTVDAVGGDLLLHASNSLVLSNSSTSMTLNPDFYKLQRGGQYVNLAEDALTVSSSNRLVLQSASWLQQCQLDCMQPAVPADALQRAVNGVAGRVADQHALGERGLWQQRGHKFQLQRQHGGGRRADAEQPARLRAVLQQRPVPVHRLQPGLQQQQHCAADGSLQHHS